MAIKTIECPFCGNFTKLEQGRSEACSACNRKIDMEALGEPVAGSSQRVRTLIGAVLLVCAIGGVFALAVHSVTPQQTLDRWECGPEPGGHQAIYCVDGYEQSAGGFECREGQWIQLPPSNGGRCDWGEITF